MGDPGADVAAVAAVVARDVPDDAGWRWKRGELAVPSGEAPLCCVLRRIRGRSVRSRLLRTLIWLMPWTGFCALGAGPALSAESGSSRDR